MKPIIQFHRGLISPAISTVALILVLASANIASAQLHNTNTGVNAGASITTGDENTADGFSALQLDNTGSFNTAVGSLALQKNTAGINNTGVGYQALTLTTGGGNTALGSQALAKNTTGHNNTASGTSAMFNNTFGAFNTADGNLALNFNTKGNFNVASGYRALFRNTTGSDNTALGYQALFSNTIASQNTAVGSGALTNNTTGSPNVGIGAGALTKNTTGTDNTAVGTFALSNSVDGNNNTALGASAGTDPGIGSNNIYIGDSGFPGDTNVISIGGIAASGTPYANTFVGGIYGTVVTDRAVYVASDGHLGTLASSRRYKDEIKPMDNASEALFALQPVTFRYKQQIDPSHTLSFGLIAEEVAKVSPDLISRDKEGKPQTVRYEAVNAMLLNEFLKEHRTVQELRAAGVKQTAIAQEQAATITQMKKQIEALTATVQKVSDQLELNRRALQVAANNY